MTINSMETEERIGIIHIKNFERMLLLVPSVLRFIGLRRVVGLKTKEMVAGKT